MKTNPLSLVAATFVALIIALSAHAAAARPAAISAVLHTARTAHHVSDTISGTDGYGNLVVFHVEATLSGEGHYDGSAQQTFEGVAQMGAGLLLDLNVNWRAFTPSAQSKLWQIFAEAHQRQTAFVLDRAYGVKLLAFRAAGSQGFRSLEALANNGCQCPCAARPQPTCAAPLH